MSGVTDSEYIDFLQGHVRDLRAVLEALHESDPWIPRKDFKDAFVESGLSDLYDDMFGGDQ